MSWIPLLFLARSLNAKLKVELPTSAGYQDTVRPLVSISFPAQNQRITPKSYPFTLKITGTAYDNVGIKKVEVSVGSTFSEVTTTGQNSWSFSTGITEPGEKTITVRAMDAAGNTFIISQKFEAQPVEVVVIPPQQPGTLAFMHGINLHTFPLSGVTTHDKRMKFVKENGFEFIRYRVYWENYVNDPVKYAADIKATADAADKYGIKVIYTNIQYELSSFFGSGGFGFPPAMVQGAIGPMSQYSSAREAQKAFLRKYWDNQGGLWDAHANFMLSVFAPYNDRASTLGYEIFNEPPLLADGDHEKLKASQEYIANRLLAVDPDAWIVAGHRFLWYSAPTGSFWSDALIPRSIPSTGKVIYAPHWYLEAALSTAGFDYVVGQIAKIQAATGATVMLGEWNDRTRPADISKYKNVIETCKGRGWPVCLWQFDGNDANNRCFNTNYDVETARNVWPTLLSAMGRPQVGAPK